MLKNFILPIFTIFIFSACSLKMPTFGMPSFLNFKKDYSVILAEADKCQILEDDIDKLTCYQKIEKTNSFAQIRLGTYYAEKEEYSSALKYLNQAKENKNIYANLPIAFLYYKGQGVSKNLDKSFELLKDASDVDPIAALQLSRFYIQGINTKVDYDKGVDLLIFAGENNVPAAQEILVTTYKDGNFKQPKDQKKVEYWENKIKQTKEDKNFKIYKF